MDILKKIVPKKSKDFLLKTIFINMEQTDSQQIFENMLGLLGLLRLCYHFFFFINAL